MMLNWVEISKQLEIAANFANIDLKLEKPRRPKEFFRECTKNYVRAVFRGVYRKEAGWFKTVRFPELQPVFDFLRNRKVHEKYVIPGEEHQFSVDRELREYAKMVLGKVLSFLESNHMI